MLLVIKFPLNILTGHSGKEINITYFEISNGSFVYVRNYNVN